MRITPSPWLHEEVAGRMAERLGWIKLRPTAWAHWGPVRGGLQGHARVAGIYPDSQCFMVEASVHHAHLAINSIVKPWWNLSRWMGTSTRFSRLARFETPPDASVQMLWSNMALHMAPDPQALIAQWHRALAVDGFLMFSCLGPDTLRELRELYQRLGWPPPSHEFTDMHDWGDMLVAAGFAEPVMDMERITLSFATPERLLAELRQLGRNLHPARFGGLRGRRWQRQLHQALAHHLQGPQSANGDASVEGGVVGESRPLTLTFEVIYGHALKPAPRLRARPEATMSLDDMRLALAQGKTTKPAG
jgi:malonyl-CoA O-methyltransferase